MDITKERIKKILSAGATVVLTTGGIDDLCLKYFVEAGAMAVRRCKKADLRRIAKATGGRQRRFTSSYVYKSQNTQQLNNSLLLSLIRFRTLLPYISHSSAVRPTLQTLAPIQSFASFSQHLFGLPQFLCPFTFPPSINFCNVWCLFMCSK